MNFSINRKRCVNFASYALMNLIMNCQNVTTTSFLPNMVLLSLAIWISPYALLTCPLASFGGSIHPWLLTMPTIIFAALFWPSKSVKNFPSAKLFHHTGCSIDPALVGSVHKFLISLFFAYECITDRILFHSIIKDSGWSYIHADHAKIGITQ